MQRRNFQNMFAAVLSVALIGAYATHSAMAQVTVFSDQATFVAATDAQVVAIPESNVGFPDTSCGGSQYEPTGWGLNLVIGFGTSNSLSVTQDIQGAPPNNSRGLCIFDPDYIPAPSNTNPNIFPNPLLVGNGEDDYLIVFGTPVHSVGFELLTNYSNLEVVTLRDASNDIIMVEDISALTPTNDYQFVGFKSATAIKSLLIDTDDGYQQNEGILEFKVAGKFTVSIDIKPGSDPNCFNINGHGVVPLAILGSSDFQVGDIDPTSLSFAGMDVRLRGNGNPQCSFQFSNPDEFEDLVCQFVDDPSVWTPADDAEACVTGAANGINFKGCDSICVVP